MSDQTSSVPQADPFAEFKRSRAVAGDLAVRARDRDDDVAFQQALAAIEAMVSPSGARHGWQPSPGFRAMYDQRPDVVMFREKHGERFFDTSTPDLFAAAMLDVLKDRAEEGWYGKAAVREPFGGDKVDALKSAWLDALVSDPSRVQPPAGSTPSQAIKSWRAMPDYDLIQKSIGSAVAATWAARLCAEGADDALVAFLGYAALQGDADVSPFVKASLASGGTLAQDVSRHAYQGARAEAEQILAQAGTEPRLAGRQAYMFLWFRRDYEYEYMDTVTLERAQLPSMAAAPSPAAGPDI